MSAKILVADDDAQIREMLQSFLGKFDYEVHTAENADQAIAMMGETTYDVVLTDKNMPDRSGEIEGGMRVLRHAKEHMPRTEVIMVTGYATIETAIEAMKIGAFDYIMKPIPFDVLREKIDRILEYKGFLNAENNINVFKALNNQVLDLLKNQDGLPEAQLRDLLRVVGGRIDSIFGLQRNYEAIIQAQAEALEKIEGYVELLQDAVPKESPYSEIIANIREQSRRRVTG